jgi:hypothetical protein
MIALFMSEGISGVIIAHYSLEGHLYKKSVTAEAKYEHDGISRSISHSSAQASDGSLGLKPGVLWGCETRA